MGVCYAVGPVAAKLYSQRQWAELAATGHYRVLSDLRPMDFEFAARAGCSQTWAAAAVTASAAAAAAAKMGTKYLRRAGALSRWLRG